MNNFNDKVIEYNYKYVMSLMKKNCAIYGIRFRLTDKFSDFYKKISQEILDNSSKDTYNKIMIFYTNYNINYCSYNGIDLRDCIFINNIDILEEYKEMFKDKKSDFDVVKG